MKCPECDHKLRKRQAGFVCKNPKCKNYWKRGKGPVFPSQEVVFRFRFQPPLLLKPVQNHTVEKVKRTGWVRCPKCNTLIRNGVVNCPKCKKRVD